jgi:hypothetical protein
MRASAAGVGLGDVACHVPRALVNAAPDLSSGFLWAAARLEAAGLAVVLAGAIQELVVVQDRARAGQHLANRTEGDIALDHGESGPPALRRVCSRNRPRSAVLSEAVGRFGCARLDGTLAGNGYIASIPRPIPIRPGDRRPSTQRRPPRRRWSAPKQPVPPFHLRCLFPGAPAILRRKNLESVKEFRVTYVR